MYRLNPVAFGDALTKANDDPIIFLQPVCARHDHPCHTGFTDRLRISANPGKKNHAKNHCNQIRCPAVDFDAATDPGAKEIGHLSPVAKGVNGLAALCGAMPTPI